VGVRRRPSDVLIAGVVGAAVSGVPSTLWTVIERGDPAEGGRALGQVLLPREERTVVLHAAGAPVHLALSVGWAGVLGAVLPPRAEPLTGVIGGLAIAALDLAVLGRLFPPIRALPQGRQWADHVAFGLSVGAVLAATRRAGRRPAPDAAA
jgi:membrane associated rhomboid family serine protease